MSRKDAGQSGAGGRAGGAGSAGHGAWPTLRPGRQPGPAAVGRHQLHLGDRRRLPGDVHAGGLRAAGDRLLARQELRARSSRRSSRTSRSPAFVIGRSASRSRSVDRSGRSSGRTGSSWRLRQPVDRLPGHGLLGRDDRVEVGSSSRLLRRLARDRVGHDARAHQVRRLPHLRGRLQLADLPDRLGLGLGGGWLQANVGMQDFAGSTAVHLIGATGAFAALLHLGARRGKYGPDGKPAGHPRAQHAALRARRADPVARLVRVQPRLDAAGARRPLHRGRAHHAARRLRGRARGHLRRLRRQQEDRHRHGRQRRDRRAGRHHGAVGLRRPLGRGGHRARGRHHRAARRLRIDRKLDDPVGALTAHGLCGIWGTLSCGLFTLPALAKFNAVGKGGLFYTGSFEQLGRQALGVGRCSRSSSGLLRDLLGDQEDLRPAGQRRGRGRRPRHLRARHVRLPGAVHPGP